MNMRGSGTLAQPLIDAPTRSARAFWFLFPAMATAGLAPAYVPYVLVPGAACYLIATGRLPRLTHSALPALALGAWALLTLLWTIDLTASVAGLRLLWSSLLLFVLVAGDVLRTGSWRIQLQGIGSAAAIVAVIYLLFARPAWSGPSALLTGNPGRIALPFIGVNYTAYAIALGVAATVALLGQRVARPSRRATVLCSLGLLIDAAALVRTDTRGAQLGAILAVVAAVLAVRWAWVALRAGFAALVVAAVLALTGALAPIIDSADVTQLFSGRDRGLSGREMLWESVLLVAQHRPLTGYGIDAYDRLLWNGIAAHNMFLASLLGVGAIGLLLYGGLLATIFWAGRRQAASSRADMADGARVRAIILAASVPIWSTGVWEWSLVNWSVLGVCAGIATLVTLSQRVPRN